MSKYFFTSLLSILLGLISLESKAWSSEIKIGKDDPSWKIFVSPDAPDTVNLAAKDLSEYIHRVTGATLSITSTIANDDRNIIYLGDTKFARDKGINTNSLPPDGFRILSGDDWVIIAGKDYTGKPMSGTDNPYRLNETYNDVVKISAFGDAGTLQGVYYFLRQFFGVRWYMPGELGEVVPTVKQVAIPLTDMEKSPVFPYRYPYFCFFSSSERDSLWYRRAGFGAPFPVAIQHSFGHFMKYKDTHPEYFALIDGQRDFSTLSTIAGPGNLNLSEKTLIVQAVADINEYFDQNPGEKFFSLCPNDGMVKISEDPESQAQIDMSAGDAGKFSNYVWGFVNKVASEVIKKHPDRFIGCIAYEHYNFPPTNIERLSPNIIVVICKLRRNLPDPVAKAKIADLIQKWSAKADVIYTWEYYCDVLFNAGWRGYPVFYSQNVQDDLAALKGRVKGEMIEAESWTPDQHVDPKKIIINYPGLQHPLLYVTSQLLWDPDISLGAMMDEYYKLFYGSAEKEMRLFWETAEQSWMKKSGFAPSNVYSKETIQKMLAALTAAIAVTEPGSVYRQRVELIKDEFSPAASKAARLANLKKPESSIPKVAEGKRVTGVITDSFWDSGLPILNLIDSSYSKASPATHVRVAWTEKALKISLVCFEPGMNKTKGSVTPQNQTPGAPIWDDDSIEIFLKPSGSDDANAFHFIVNSDGAFYDAINKTDSWQTEDPKWESSADVAVNREGDRWTVEMSIPWASLGLKKPQAGLELTGNFFRNRYTTGEREEFSWSPLVQGVYFTPEDFGKMTLGN